MNKRQAENNQLLFMRHLSMDLSHQNTIKIVVVPWVFSASYLDQHQSKALHQTILMPIVVCMMLAQYLARRRTNNEFQHQRTTKIKCKTATKNNNNKKKTKKKKKKTKKKQQHIFVDNEITFLKQPFQREHDSVLSENTDQTDVSESGSNGRFFRQKD